MKIDYIKVTMYYVKVTMYFIKGQIIKNYFCI